MNSLQSKIDEASNHFQNHDFKKALQLYEQCIQISRKRNEPKALVHNLISSKAAIMSILGDQRAALETVNEVLDYQPYHSLCLLRRCQIYKKKNKLNKALKDLKILLRFSPDNLQIVALKIEIQNLKLKIKQTNSQESEQQQKSNQSIDLDQEQQLNFSNLKKIDPKSVSIICKSGPSRKSRVTIAGDSAITYQATDQEQNFDSKSLASTNISKEYLKQKYIKTFKQIELDDGELQTQQTQPVQIIKIKTPSRQHKSILKNRDSTLYVNMTTELVEKQSKYGGRESRMIDLLKNIDGKVIESMENQRISVSIQSRPSKQVEFRKSIFGGAVQIKETTLGITPSENGNSKPKSGQRKSCLKLTPSNSINLEANVTKAEPRRSKLERISKVGIDGIVLKKNDNFIQNQLKIDKNDSDSRSDSDSNSQHNIFGGNQLVITKQIRQNLGIGDGSYKDIQKKTNPKHRTTGAKSILKKNSIIVKSTDKTDKPSGIAKKSVMFTRFNNSEQ